MKLFRKFTYKILLFSSLFLAFIIALFLFTITNNNNNSDQINSAKKQTEFFCGTESLPVKAQAGKKIFNNNCAVCHKLDVNMTGPALRNIDSIVFNKWIRTNKPKIDTTKLDKFGIDYHWNLSNNFLKSDSEKLYEYLIE